MVKPSHNEFTSNKAGSNPSIFLMKKFKQFVIFSLIWTCFALPLRADLVSATKQENEVSNEKLPQNKDGNFTLYLSNQSPEVSPVDFIVFIDGKQAASVDMDVGSGFLHQHTWRKFVYELPAGEHEIKVVSVKGDIVKKKVFQVEDELWCSVSYFYDPTRKSRPIPRTLNIRFRDGPLEIE